MVITLLPTHFHTHTHTHNTIQHPQTLATLPWRSANICFCVWEASKSIYSTKWTCHSRLFNRGWHTNRWHRERWNTKRRHTEKRHTERWHAGWKQHWRCCTLNFYIVLDWRIHFSILAIARCSGTVCVAIHMAMQATISLVFSYTIIYTQWIMKNDNPLHAICTCGIGPPEWNMVYPSTSYTTCPNHLFSLIPVTFILNLFSSCTSNVALWSAVTPLELGLATLVEMLPSASTSVHIAIRTPDV